MGHRHPKRLRVLVNALSARFGGGQTYVRNLLEHLPEDAEAEVFVLGPESLPLPGGHRNVSRLNAPASTTNPLARAAWERAQLPKLLRRIGADVLFCPGGIIGAAVPPGCATAVTFQNMLPFDKNQARRYPLGYARLRAAILRRALLQNMRRADLVIFISEFAKGVIERSARAKLRNSVVIPHGVGPEFSVRKSSPPPAPAWTPRRGYFLYVSTIDVYKSQMEVVQAFARLKRSRATQEKLLLVGPEYPPYGRRVREEVRSLGLSGDVVIAGKVPYDEMPDLYRNARANLFASESENCPNILLEALAAGRPVLCSNRPPMPEFGGNAALYFDPGSPADLSERLAYVLDNPRIEQELSTKAADRSRLYDWSVTAQRTWDALAALCATQP